MSEFRFEREAIEIPPSVDEGTMWKRRVSGPTRYYVDDVEVTPEEYADRLAEECGD